MRILVARVAAVVCFGLCSWLPSSIAAAQTQIAFSGTPDSRVPAEFLKQIEKTVGVQSTPVLGGVESLAPLRLNYIYNSLPYGNCGVLNTMGAALYSSLTGEPFRLRATMGHVATEIRGGILDTYTGSLLTNGQGLFTMDQLASAEPWTGQRAPYQFLFEKPLAPEAKWATVSEWRKPVLKLTETQRFTESVAGFDSLDLVEMPAFNMRELDANLRVNHAALPVRIGRVTAPAKSGVFAPPFLITGATLTLSEWPQIPTDVFKLASAMRVYPVAPEGAIDVSSATWKPVANTPIAHGHELLLSPGTHIRLETGYTNHTDKIQAVWLPLRYRTAEPSRHGDGKPIGTLVSGNQFWSGTALYPRTMGAYYADIILPVMPGEKATIDFYAFKSVQIASGVPEISSVLSPHNPAMAIRYEVANQSPGSVALTFMINPAFKTPTHPSR